MDPRLARIQRIMAPIETHRRQASCEEVNCKYLSEGWRIVVEEGPRADEIIARAKLSGRTFEITKELSYSLGVRKELEQVRNKKSAEDIKEWLSLQDLTRHVILTFTSGQQCFNTHTVSLHRPPLYLVRDGMKPYRQVADPSNWVAEFQDHLQKTANQ